MPPPPHRLHTLCMPVARNPGVLYSGGRPLAGAARRPSAGGKPGGARVHDGPARHLRSGGGVTGRQDGHIGGPRAGADQRAPPAPRHRRKRRSARWARRIRATPATAGRWRPRTGPAPGGSAAPGRPSPRAPAGSALLGWRGPQTEPGRRSPDGAARTAQPGRNCRRRRPGRGAAPGRAALHVPHTPAPPGLHPAGLGWLMSRPDR